MVNKDSLRSNKRSSSTSKDKDTKETAKKTAVSQAAKPTRSSSRRSKKTSEEEGSQEIENGTDDVEMKDDTQSTIQVASQPRKDNDGDVEMDVDEKGPVNERGKYEPTEDPAVMAFNGSSTVSPIC